MMANVFIHARQIGRLKRRRHCDRYTNANGTQRVARIDQMKRRRAHRGVYFFYEGKVFERRRIHVKTIKRKTLSFARGVPEHCVGNFFVLPL